MSRNFYQILGVSETATDSRIARAHQATRAQIAADPALSEPDRAARLNEVDTAFHGLSTPDLRDQYDSKVFGTQSHPAKGSAASTFLSPMTLVAVALVIAVAGAGYWTWAREQQRVRAEADRIASEKAEEKRRAELEARMARERSRLQEEIRAQKEAEEKQRELAMEIRKDEMQKKHIVADERYVNPQQQQLNYLVDQVARNSDNYTQQRQRMEDQMNLRRAQQEVERQKRYLEQREREEAYERARKDANSRYR